jgi:hypothetical protein
MVPIIPIAMGLASVIPSIAKLFGGPKAESVANKVVDVAKAVTGMDDPQKAVETLRGSPDLILQFKSKILDSDIARDLAEFKDDASRRQDIRDSGPASRAVRPYIAISFHTVVLGILLFREPALLKQFLAISLVEWGSLDVTMGGAYVIIIFFYFLTKGVKDFLIGKNPIGI